MPITSLRLRQTPAYLASDLVTVDWKVSRASHKAFPSGTRHMALNLT